MFTKNTLTFLKLWLALSLFALCLALAAQTATPEPLPFKIENSLLKYSKTVTPVKTTYIIKAKEGNPKFVMFIENGVIRYHRFANVVVMHTAPVKEMFIIYYDHAGQVKTDRVANFTLVEFP